MKYDKLYYVWSLDFQMFMIVLQMVTLIWKKNAWDKQVDILGFLVCFNCILIEGLKLFCLKFTKLGRSSQLTAFFPFIIYKTSPWAEKWEMCGYFWETTSPKSPFSGRGRLHCICRCLEGGNIHFVSVWTDIHKRDCLAFAVHPSMLQEQCC